MGAEQTISKCAVLLTVYNGRQYLEEQMKSILNQTDVQVTVFASSDISNDGSEALLDKLAAIDERIVILPHGMKFGGAARNFFRLIRDVDLSRFDYISFADQDDIWHVDKLIKAVTILKKSDHDGYSSNVMAFWPNGKRKLIHKAQPQSQWDFIFEAAGPGCTYVMSRKLMQAIKQCMQENWEALQSVSLHDWFCYAFARANGYKWHIDAEPSMLYRQHGKNQVGVNFGLKAYIYRLKKMTNGWWLSQANLIASLIGMRENPFVKSWTRLGRLDLLRLAGKAFQCRRNVQEKFVFLLMCLILAITGQQEKINNLNTNRY
ncbi:glycosyltransferase [Legionella israelensis]|uniref:Glycosyltransferase n=1 Tax=Legionella israelensis TaxID=454 RepID=A0AAX1EHH8_9GAMM|nr:glycosyltransferase [Legionella israelensis]QBR84528.1 glycosyltransferase [Legionella israelensis]